MCPWRDLKNLCSESMGRTLVGLCRESILRSVHEYNEEVRATVPHAGGGVGGWGSWRKIPPGLKANSES